MSRFWTFSPIGQKTFYQIWPPAAEASKGPGSFQTACNESLQNKKLKNMYVIIEGGLWLSVWCTNLFLSRLQSARGPCTLNAERRQRVQNPQISYCPSMFLHHVKSVLLRIFFFVSFCFKIFSNKNIFKKRKKTLTETLMSLWRFT